ncbi:MAG: FitA-like ribbon-helix-helix domain-containing protein [Thermomicrobiales bacterium]
MAALTIRNLDDDVKAKLRIRAAHNGRSMEAEAREILDEAVNGRLGSMRRIPDFSGPEWDDHWQEDEDDSDSRSRDPHGDDFVQSIRRRFLAIGGVELDIPPRTDMPRKIDLS